VPETPANNNPRNPSACAASDSNSQGTLAFLGIPWQRIDKHAGLIAQPDNARPSLAIAQLEPIPPGIAPLQAHDLADPATCQQSRPPDVIFLWQ
jgi:hypothetical protein